MNGQMGGKREADGRTSGQVEEGRWGTNRADEWRTGRTEHRLGFFGRRTDEEVE